MVDSIFSQKTLKPGMIARLKVGGAPKAADAAGMTKAEQRLIDTLKLSDGAKNRLMQGRKLDGYLRIFSSALKIMNGVFSGGYKPVQSTIDIEYTDMKNPGIDKKV